MTPVCVIIKQSGAFYTRMMWETAKEDERQQGVNKWKKDMKVI